MTEAVRTGNKIIFCGNGGSAADSQHLAAELVGRYLTDRAALPALALTVDTSALTAIGNDYSFAAVFARQLSGLGKPGDAVSWPDERPWRAHNGVYEGRGVIGA